MIVQLGALLSWVSSFAIVDSEAGRKARSEEKI